MANHISALKRNRQNLKRRARNRQLKSKLKTSFKKLQTLIEEKNKEKATEFSKQVISLLDKAGRKGVIKRKNTSNKVSKITKKINLLVKEPIAQ